MPSTTTKQLSFNSAEQFKESFAEPDPTIGYVFIGNHVPYPDENTPPNIIESVADEKSAWDNMFAAKRVTGNDVELVIPRYDWAANVVYSQYDDRIPFSQLFETSNSKPMYIITTARNVYKCLSNNANALSTIEPTGDFTTSNGNIATADGYIWKYMFNVKPSNKFFTSSWVPAPVSTDSLDYGVSTTGVVDGELTQIVVTDSGQNYRQASNIRVDAFAAGANTIRLTNIANTLAVFSIPNLANLANMSISGAGISNDSYISSINTINGDITLSIITNGAGGGSNDLTISTRIYINGDGTGAIANAVLSNTSSGVSSANANVSKITVTTIGINYSYANAFVFGSGTGATARVVLPPKYGHAYNPGKELNANNVMVAVRIGEIDSTENGLIPVNTSFRQFGLLRDPYKYGETSPVDSANANTVISQTTNLSLVAGFPYTLNEYVYQENGSGVTTAYGFVCSQGTNQVNLTKVRGTFSIGPLIGANSGISRTVISTTEPTFQPYSGDMLYIENDPKTDRADGQAENIKLVVSF